MLRIFSLALGVMLLTTSACKTSQTVADKNSLVGLAPTLLDCLKQHSYDCYQGYLPDAAMVEKMVALNFPDGMLSNVDTKDVVSKGLNLMRQHAAQNFELVYNAYSAKAWSRAKLIRTQEEDATPIGYESKMTVMNIVFIIDFGPLGGARNLRFNACTKLDGKWYTSDTFLWE